MLQEAGWAPGPVWTVLEKRKSIDSTGIQTPDRRARHPGFPGSRVVLLKQFTIGGYGGLDMQQCWTFGRARHDQVGCPPSWYSAIRWFKLRSSGRLDRVFSLFFSVYPLKRQESAWNQAMAASFHILSIHFSLNFSGIPCYIQGGSNMTGTDLCVNKPVTVPVIFEPPCS